MRFAGGINDIASRKVSLAAVLVSILLLGGGPGRLSAQDNPCFPFAAAASRALTAGKLKSSIDSLLQAFPDPMTQGGDWQQAFWAMQLMSYKPQGFRSRLPDFFSRLPACTPGFQRAFLEMLHTLYPKKHARPLRPYWNALGDAKNQAMALEYLAAAGVFPAIRASDRIFGTGWHEAYAKRWQGPQAKKPYIRDFQRAGLLTGEPLLCSFQSSDRDRPGYLMIRMPDGRWLADARGQPIKIVQLARSLSNLPYYLTNGNTPQGL